MPKSIFRKPYKTLTGWDANHPARFGPLSWRQAEEPIHTNDDKYHIKKQLFKTQ